jgi:TetR/AcrR family transcriptional repressor of nem operon
LSRVSPQMKKPELTTRDRLIESARFLFWERGFAATSMSELLAHANVNSGSFYHFFDSKEALLREVLQTYVDLLRPMVVDPAFAAAKEPLTRIFAILSGYRQRILATDSRYGCPLGRLALEIDTENAPAHELIATNFRAWTGAIEECLDAMADALPPKTDRAGLATFVLVVMVGGVMLSRSYRSPEPFDQAVARLREHFHLLVRPASPQETRKVAGRRKTSMTLSGA